MRSVSARTGYIYQAKPEYCHLTCRGHVRARKDCPWAFYMHKIGSPCLHSMHAHLPAKAILHPYGSINLRKIVRVLLRDTVKAVSARTGYINQGIPEYVPFTLYKPCMSSGRLPRGLPRAQNRRKLCMLSFQQRLYCALTDPKVFETSCGPAQHSL